MDDNTATEERQVRPHKPYETRSQRILERQKQVINLKKSNPGLSGTEIGKIAGMHKSQVSRILRRYNIANKQLTGYKALEADIMAGVKERIISEISEEDIKSADLRDKIVSFGILDDKEHRMRQKTSGDTLAGIVESLDTADRVKITQVEITKSSDTVTTDD